MESHIVQFFYIKDNKVLFKEKFSILPEYIQLKEWSKNQDNLDKILTYIHFVYSKKSPYFYIEINDRKKIVCSDRFEDITISDKIDKIPEVKKFVEKYNALQFTENETFLNGVREKISEYLRYWQSNPITKSNAAEIQEQLKGAKDLLKVKKEMEEIVFEEIKSQNLAKESGTKMFEDS